MTDWLVIYGKAREPVKTNRKGAGTIAAPPMPTPPSPVHAPIDHYENFPVASWLCPPRLRAPIAAIYHFARTADDIADEGDAPAARRLADLAAYRRELHASAAGAPPEGSRWPQVFGPLAAQVRAFGLPLPPFDDLLSAFAQDVAMTRDGAAYPDLPALLDYCRRSANPVGRLLLHLYGVRGAEALAESDAVCTALQLINFWQDLSVDIPRGRYYLPLADCAAHGLAITDPASRFPALRPDPETTKLIAHLASHARCTACPAARAGSCAPWRRAACASSTASTRSAPPCSRNAPRWAGATHR